MGHWQVWWASIASSPGCWITRSTLAWEQLISFTLPPLPQTWSTSWRTHWCWLNLWVCRSKNALHFKKNCKRFSTLNLASIFFYVIRCELWMNKCSFSLTDRKVATSSLPSMWWITTVSWRSSSSASVTWAFIITCSTGCVLIWAPTR